MNDNHDILVTFGAWNNSDAVFGSIRPVQGTHEFALFLQNGVAVVKGNGFVLSNANGQEVSFRNCDWQSGFIFHNDACEFLVIASAG